MKANVFIFFSFYTHRGRHLFVSPFHASRLVTMVVVFYVASKASAASLCVCYDVMLQIGENAVSVTPGLSAEEDAESCGDGCCLVSRARHQSPLTCIPLGDIAYWAFTPTSFTMRINIHGVGREVRFETLEGRQICEALMTAALTKRIHLLWAPATAPPSPCPICLDGPEESRSLPFLQTPCCGASVHVRCAVAWYRQIYPVSRCPHCGVSDDEKGGNENAPP